ELPSADARAYMKEYFAEGGDMAAVAEWLSLAGSHLPTPTKQAGTDGAVIDVLGDVADAAGDLVSNMVDAVVSAGKSIADAVSEAAAWSVSKVSDLIKALAKAGKSVASILTEASKKGASVLKKFVEAAIRAGRSVGEVLAWAIGKAASTLRNTLTAILRAGRRISDILAWAAVKAATTLRKVLAALEAIGKTVAQILYDAVRLAASLLKKVVAQLYRVVRDIGEILIAVINLSASVIRTVLEGLFAAGLNLARIVASICADVAEGFREGFFRGLLALGKGALAILKAAAATSLAMLALAFAVFLEIWGGHRPLTREERRQAQLVFGSSIELDRVKVAIASIPADVVNWLNGQRPFTTMYVINFASWAHVDMRTLIHELTHVWQGVVAGPVYMVEALHSQFFGRGYEVTDADIAAADGDLGKLEREQQAVVVERYWAGRWGEDDSVDWQALESLARDVYRPLRGIVPGRVHSLVPVVRTVRPLIRIP
ncbi:MAG TPA: hypothetical protein VKU85_09315, partial [bacterium]|nr:hypothetical protein [bacterium]